MALVRWNRNDPSERQSGQGLSERECFDDDRTVRPLLPYPGWVTRATMAFMPRVDVINSEREIVIKADLPGLDVSDLDLSVTRNLLTLRGERHDEELEEGTCYCCRESSIGGFERTIELPEEVLADEAQATLKNGVLTLRLPKVQPATPIKIEVVS